MMNQAFLKNQKISWIVKANYIQNYWYNSNDLKSCLHELGISEDTFWDYLRLAKFLKEYPQLAKIPNKTSAALLINQFENPKQFRALLNFEATKYKSALILNKMRVNLYESNHISNQGAKED